ncbi:hypothetical protein ONZ45_g4093 [Pleurotus djamor]|nr:hypothetical protein ONZ45_g4093 [Pleurotus djamor]
MTPRRSQRLTEPGFCVSSSPEPPSSSSASPVEEVVIKSPGVTNVARMPHVVNMANAAGFAAVANVAGTTNAPVISNIAGATNASGTSNVAGSTNVSNIASTTNASDTPNLTGITNTSGTPNVAGTTNASATPNIAGTTSAPGISNGVTSIISRLSSVTNFNEYIWSHDRLLRAHFPPASIRVFRALQAASGLVISGVSAMAYLSVISDAGRELDLYVQVDSSLAAGTGLEHLDCIALTPAGEKTTFTNAVTKFNTGPEDRCPRYFVRDDGLACTQGNVQFANKIVYAVIPFLSPLRTRINLVISICPVANLITYFHSTMLFNAITANNCYSFFPRETVVDRVALSIQSKEVYQSDVRAKFRSYGYRIVSNGVEACKLNMFYPGPRSVSAGNVLMIPMVRADAVLPCLVDDDLRSAQYVLTFTGQLFADAKIAYIKTMANTDTVASGGTRHASGAEGQASGTEGQASGTEGQGSGNMVHAAAAAGQA